MEYYRDERKVSAFAECDSTISFIKRLDKLIKAMSSRTPLDALYPNDACPSKNVSFLK